MGLRIPKGASGFRSPVAFGAAGITRTMGSYWAKTGLVRPSVATADGRGSARLYAFRDVVALRAVRDLRAAGLSLQAIRKALVTIANHWPEIEAPLSEGRIVTDGSEAWFAANEAELVALVRQPGQAGWRIVLDAGRIAREVREALPPLEVAA